ncbi:MAG: orotidine-5'-phosphate decarboxylase [bacterium]
MDNKRIIVALDSGNLEDAAKLAAELKDLAGYFKIGKELFTAHGPKSVNTIRDQGVEVFLDLKFHDIPNTVAGACTSALYMGANMINMHIMGGKAMVRTAVERVNLECSKSGLPKPILLGVTVLTSLDDQMLFKDLHIYGNVADQVVHLSRLGKELGLDGVVCSPLEIELVRQACGSGFILVTPGIRPKWAVKDDQQRITTPADAVRMGADFIVIGRPITGAENPREAAEKIQAEIDNVL